MFARYRKSISALVAAIAGWGLAASADAAYTQQEWWGLVVLLGGVVAVWGIANDTPAGIRPDPNISERGATSLEVAVWIAAGCLVVLVLIGFGVID